MIFDHIGGRMIEMSNKVPPMKIFTMGPMIETLARILELGVPYQITAPGAIILNGKSAERSEINAIF